MNVHEKFMGRESGVPGRVSLGVSFGLPASPGPPGLRVMTPVSSIPYFYKPQMRKWMLTCFRDSVKGLYSFVSPSFLPEGLVFNMSRTWAEGKGGDTTTRWKPSYQAARHCCCIYYSLISFPQILCESGFDDCCLTDRQLARRSKATCPQHILDFVAEHCYSP